jgi:hypothetical protein
MRDVLQLGTLVLCDPAQGDILVTPFQIGGGKALQRVNPLRARGSKVIDRKNASTVIVATVKRVHPNHAAARAHIWGRAVEFSEAPAAELFYDSGEGGTRYEIEFAALRDWQASIMGAQSTIVLTIEAGRFRDPSEPAA